MVKKPLRKKPPKVSNSTHANDDAVPWEIPGRDEKNEPPDSLLEYAITIYGTKSIGKTTLAASCDDAITMEAEPMRKGLAIRMIPCPKVPVETLLEDISLDPLPKFKATVDRICEKGLAKTLVFDTIDLIYEMFLISVSARNGVKNPSKGGRDSSAIWIELREEFQGYMNSVRYSGIGMVFLSHVKERDVEILSDEENPSIYGPSCAPACLQYIKSACDFAFYYGFDSQKRRIMTVRDDSGRIWTGCNPEGRFMDPDGNPINKIVMPSLTDRYSGFQTLVKAFNNELYDADYEPEEEKKPKRKLKRRK